MIPPIDVTNAQLDELQVYAKALETVLDDEELPSWSMLDDDEKKHVINKMNEIIDDVMPTGRFYSLVYTIKDGEIELMAIPVTEVEKFKAQQS